MRISIIICCIAILFSCENKKKEYAPLNQEIAQHEVIIKEIEQTSGYTYLLVQEKGQEYWMAVSKIDIDEGETIYYLEAMKMVDFKSTELNKVFDQIYFAEGISRSPIKAEVERAKAVESLKREKQQLLDSIKISPAPGGQSIGELYENPKDYENKSVKVRGQVVKVNSDIMDRNWVHLVDGTEGDNKSDLTFTTQEVVKVGDTVTLEGLLALDREFGAGYVYPVIVEKAVLK